MRLKRLLWLTLVTNLITNLLLIAVLSCVVYYFWIEPSTPPAKAEVTPVPTEHPTPSKTAEVPKNPEKTTKTDEPKAEDKRPFHVRMGLTEDEWDQLTAGEVLQKRVSTGERIALQAYFLVRATPKKLLDLFTNYKKMHQLYEEVKQVKVLEREEQSAMVYYKSRYGPFSLQYVVNEKWESKDETEELRWKLASHPDYPTKLRRAEGYWRFTPIGMAGLTLLSYQNDFVINGMPSSLMRKFASKNIPAIASNIKRQLGN